MQIRELRAANTFSYQNVPLPHELSTGGKDRSKTARAILLTSISDRSSTWSVANRALDQQNLILQFYFSKRLVDGDLYHHSRALADVLAAAERVTIVTVRCPRDRLLAQFRAGRTGNRKKTMLSRQRRQKIKQLSALYESETALNEMFEDWFAFVRRQPDQGFVFEYGTRYQASTVADWETARR